MIRVAIVEDEASYVEQIEGFLKQYQKEYGQVIEVTVFSDGDEIVSNYRAEFDIIFLDVQMSFMDGMTAAEHIRQMDLNVIIIFITNMAQYAIRGYAVNALDYIIKPVSYFAFSMKFKRAVALYKQREKKYITLKVDGGIARIPLNEIYYIESMKHRIIVHAETMDYSLICTMKEMEVRLASEDFFRCNNCYLVNLAQVKRVYNNEVFVGEYNLSISRPRRKAFMDALTDYMGGMT